jgi:hypothetical protein
MKTFTAIFPARQIQKHTIPSSNEVFTQSDVGKWSSKTAGKLLESEVIDWCKSASNWAEIKAQHFAMHGFHN